LTRPTGILVVGGYGVVGRRIAAHLAAEFPGRVLIAGRDEQRAAAVSVEIGEGTKPRRVDVNDPPTIERALDGVGTIISCVAQREMHLLRASIGHGLAYTDVAPRLAFWEGAEKLSHEARKSGARIVLGAGLSPGISNMMAAQLAKTLGRMERLETAILLSLGDEYGPDSLKHFVDALMQAYTVLEDGERREALPFSEAERMLFPEPLGLRIAYLFPWSDVVYYPKSLGARTALGRLALDPPWVGRLASLLVRAGARSWLRRRSFFEGNRRFIDRLKRCYANHDAFGLVVTAENAGHIVRMSLAGRHQADVTAAGAAELTRALAAEEIGEPGVWLPEQVISYQGFFDAIGSMGWEPSVEEVSRPAEHF
jgi:saccharopine dehydrogenase-like NADP-dependent oxidoreductase